MKEGLEEEWKDKDREGEDVGKYSGGTTWSEKDRESGRVVGKKHGGSCLRLIRRGAGGVQKAYIKRASKDGVKNDEFIDPKTRRH